MALDERSDLCLWVGGCGVRVRACARTFPQFNIINFCSIFVMHSVQGENAYEFKAHGTLVQVNRSIITLQHVDTGIIRTCRSTTFHFSLCIRYFSLSENFLFSVFVKTLSPLTVSKENRTNSSHNEARVISTSIKNGLGMRIELKITT